MAGSFVSSKVLKLVARNGDRLHSAFYDERSVYCVHYRPGHYVQRSKWPMLVYDEVWQALNFIKWHAQPENLTPLNLELWHATATGPVEIPYGGRLLEMFALPDSRPAMNEFWAGDLEPEFLAEGVILFKPPIGTSAYQRVRLTKKWGNLAAMREQIVKNTLLAAAQTNRMPSMTKWVKDEGTGLNIAIEGQPPNPFEM